jgi:1-pyrroline-5-carboxylate dehydrogenase
MVTGQAEQKITYTTMGVDQAEAFNRAYDAALEEVQGQLGAEQPVYIDGEAVKGAEPCFEDRSPNDTRILIGTFQECRQPEADRAVAAARTAFPEWSHRSWDDRVELMRRTANIFRERKYSISALLSLEAGKSRIEAMGEVEEAADLIDGYCDYAQDNHYYVKTLEQLSPNEHNRSVLRPYGVFAVISPFNFPAALTTGMVAAALLTGNTVVFKPSHETPFMGVKVYECFRDAGLPVGALNFVTGFGNELGEMLSGHPDVDGIAFIGSARVGTHIYAEFSKNRPRPCIAEMGGKNPTIVSQHADLTKAVEGTARAAFGYSGQKCSATSRVYVHESIAEEFIRRLVERTESIAIGPAQRADVFTGPVINESAYKRYGEVVERARRDGTLHTGGTTLTEGDLQYGYYCAPTVASLPADHGYFFEELFVPFISVATFSRLDEAMTLANDAKYGLTAGIFTEDEAEQQEFLDRIEAGVVYVNRTAGSTTGAWPKVQSFGGWKMSGSTGKSALGPYYIQQFLHEQSQTIVTD